MGQQLVPADLEKITAGHEKVTAADEKILEKF